jgi:nuclear pore complex protein Nup160
MSIFSEASAASARDCQHLLSWPASSPLPHTAATYYTHEAEEAVFVLANSLGQLTCVRLGGKVRGMTAVHQLAAPSSYLGRVWTSLTRGAATHAQEDQPQSLVIAPLGQQQQLLLASVCRDHKVRVWSLASYECVLATDLVQFTAEAGRELAQGAQAHRISLVQQQQHKAPGKGLPVYI